MSATIVVAGVAIAGVTSFTVAPAHGATLETTRVESGSTGTGAMTMPGMTMPGMTMPEMTMPGMTMPAPSSAAADSPPVATTAVAIQNFAYSPGAITVKAGTAVTWTNQDQDPHTVTSVNGGPLNSPPLNNGQSFRYTFTKPGHYDYLCTVHPFMTATVVVTP